ncbi:MAG: hypothetical protein MJZ73_06320 [Bacteroidaceae bacterium]|nr:hypothetical protein [Bacteroidaceae bacterium]
MDKEKRNKKKSTARVVAKKYSQKQVAAELASFLSAQTVLALALFFQIFFYTLLWLMRA